MARLFKRRVSVIVDGLRVDGLRVQFSIKKTLTKDPNSLDLKITNLSEQTRANMQKVGAAVVVSAGYVEDSAIVFQGDARTIDHVRSDAEWITHVQCGDGERAYRWARFSESFAPGTAIADVVRAAARALGINTGNLDDMLAAGNFRGQLTEFTHGFTAHGRAQAELDRLLKSLGFTWSIQDGALQVLKDSDPVRGSAVLLAPETGLIGSPDHGTPEKKGKPAPLKAVSLLNPHIRCGGRVEIRSTSIKGLFRVEKVEHAGDTAGAEWYTKIEALPAPAGEST